MHRPGDAWATTEKGSYLYLSTICINQAILCYQPPNSRPHSHSHYRSITQQLYHKLPQAIYRYDPIRRAKS